MKFLTVILSIAVFHLNLLSISAIDCCAVEAPSIECAHHAENGLDKESSDSDNKTHHKTEQCGCAVCHIAVFSQLKTSTLKTRPTIAISTEPFYYTDSYHATVVEEIWQPPKLI